MSATQNRMLLIEPPFDRLYTTDSEDFTISEARYPLSLGYLADSILKHTDWNLTCYSADFSPEVKYIDRREIISRFDIFLDNINGTYGKIWQEVRDTLEECKPGVVGISANSANFVAARIIARLSKELNEDVIVIVGGSHPSTAGSDVLNCRHIDISVKGEGERTIVELLDAIENNKGLGDIKGIIYRENGQIKENLPRDFIEDLDSLGFPHQNAPDVLKDYENYPPSAFNRIFAARGCPFGCTFCASKKVWSRRVRFRSADNVIEEINSIRNNVGIDYVVYDDDTFGISRENIENLCFAMKEHSPGLSWGCEIHANLVDDHAISIMKESGCDAISLGFESGNDEMLRTVKKNTTTAKALSACKVIKKYDIKLNTFFIIGFPWETEESLKDTQQAMIKTNADSIVYGIFTPYPGTELFDLCKENGLIDDRYDVSLYNHQSPKNSFCFYIEPERFRELASETELLVDRLNARSRLKGHVTMKLIQKVREIGVKQSLKKGVEILRAVAET